jgi:rhodanese-related sulfurtransferase
MRAGLVWKGQSDFAALAAIWGNFMSGPIVENVTLDELKKGLADGSMILVDVREANEYEAGHIPGAIFQPLSTFDPAALPNEPGKRVVLSCRSGRRTLLALEQAQNAGRSDITTHFGGGMLAWDAAGEPVEM